MSKFFREFFEQKKLKLFKLKNYCAEKIFPMRNKNGGALWADDFDIESIKYFEIKIIC